MPRLSRKEISGLQAREDVSIRRLAWVGPWHETSAIARFGAYVCEALAARGVSVTVFRSETGDFAARPPLPPPPGGALARGANASWTEFDAVVVNIGDHFGNHGGALSVLEATPAVVILHDGYLVNLAAGVANGRGDDGWLRCLVEELYGPDAWPADQPFHAGIETVAQLRPLTEWIAALSGAALTHSRHWEERIRAACPGPVTVRPLAYPGRPLPPKRSRDSFVVASIGHINPNRCIEQLLEAVAAERQAGRTWEVRLLGPVSDTTRAQLTAHAAELGVPPPVFTGWLDDDALMRNLAEADVIACLRNPVLEAASASLVTAMRAERPVLVCWHGCYAEVPKELVHACRPGHEAEDVQRHLAFLAERPEEAASLARRARDWAERAFSADGYAEDLLQIVQVANRAWPAIAMQRRFGERLGALGLSITSSAVARLAARLADTLGSSDARGDWTGGVHP